MCRNAVYNIEPVLEAPTHNMESFYNRDPDVMSTSHDFHGEGERLGYVKAEHGDKKVQGVLNYPNHDLYGYGGISPIQSSYPAADIDLDECASNGFHYF